MEINKQVRGPNKVQRCYNMKEMYLDYIKDKVPDTPYYISFQEYLDICEVYYKGMVNEIIYKSRTIKLPFRLGHLTVMKKKPKVLSDSTLSIDWKESRAYGKLIRHINDHSNGFKYRFFWSKKQSFVVNQSLYRLVFSRDNKRLLAKVIKSGEIDYLEVL